MKYTRELGVWLALRLVMGWMFAWAFFDKLFGLGFATAPEKAWLAGGSPTAGFLSHASGWFGGIFQAMAGMVWVDWLFMIGLIAIGLSLLLGIGMRVAGWSGALMVLLMWLAQFPPVHNPVIDEHTVYLLALVGLATVGLPSGSVFGLGAWWANLPLVKKYPWLR